MKHFVQQEPAEKGFYCAIDGYWPRENSKDAVIEHALQHCKSVVNTLHPLFVGEQLQSRRWCLEKNVHANQILKTSYEQDFVVNNLKSIRAVATLKCAIESEAGAEFLVLGEYKDKEGLALLHYRVTSPAADRFSLELVAEQALEGSGDITMESLQGTVAMHFRNEGRTEIYKWNGNLSDSFRKDAALKIIPGTSKDDRISLVNKARSSEVTT